MKTILVTGSNGLLGQKITRKILQEGRLKLIATSKGLNRYPEKDGYHYVEMDLLLPDQVKQVVEKHHPDAIIHTAAITNVDTCQADPEACYQLNVHAVKQLTEICEQHHIQLIHLSTDFVFDGENGPYKEEDEPNPLSVYGHSKLQAEKIITASAARWVIIRTILVYGTSFDGSRSNIVLWAKNALEKGQPVKVVNDQWRTPTLVDDLAEACLLAVEKNAQGLYHISGKDYMNIAGLVKKVAEYWALDLSHVEEINSATLNQSAKRPIKTGFFLNKAIAELGYKPHSFEEGLQMVDDAISSV